MSTDLTAAVDLAPSVTAVAGAVKEVAAGVVQVDKEMNTPAMIDAGLEAHARAAKERFDQALAAGDVETLRKMAAL